MSYASFYRDVSKKAEARLHRYRKDRWITSEGLADADPATCYSSRRLGRRLAAAHAEGRGRGFKLQLKYE